MRYVIAIIQPDRLDDVLRELESKEIHLVTVTTVLGRGRQKGVAEVYRSRERRQRGVRQAHNRGHHQGRPHRADRRREDLRAGSEGRGADPDRRNGQSGDRITTLVFRSSPITVSATGGACNG
jgi:hypothetical protein